MKKNADLISVVISAGHYAGRPGASFAGISEWPLTLTWAKEIRNALAYFGTPEKNTLLLENLPLKEKVNAINAIARIPALAVEVHFNSSFSGGSGAETLYTPGSQKSQKAASIIHEFMLTNVPKIKDRGIKEGWYKMDAERRIPDAFLANTRPASIILEPLFIQQTAELETMRLPMCEGIAKGISVFLNHITSNELQS